MKMEVKYQCQGLEKEELENDGYRADILKWNNQVELLNTVKGYNISHKTSSIFKDGVHQKNIALKLPNLVDQIPQYYIPDLFP
ncbi:MAG: hypothetical protein VX772_05480 [Bacteroidota bacterium]|nr:hypothetical protein [Bacteroidota bacterium]